MEGLVGDGPAGERRAREVRAGGVGEERVVEGEVVDVG